MAASAPPACNNSAMGNPVSANGTAQPDDNRSLHAISTLYQVERATVSSMNSETLLLFGAVITYIGAIAALIAGGKLEFQGPWDSWVLALPLPAWMVLGYQALLCAKIGKHSVAAQRYEDKLLDAANLTWTVPEDKLWVRIVGLQGSRLLFYGIATVLVVLGTCYCLFGDHPRGGWLCFARVAYLLAASILAVAWVSIVSKYFDSKLTQKIKERLDALGFSGPAHVNLLDTTDADPPPPPITPDGPASSAN